MRWFMVRVRLSAWRQRNSERLWRWLAWKLPKGLVEWVYMRVMRFSETNPYNDGNPTDISVMWALCYWQEEGK